jgi:hypothetical protein
VRFLVEIWNLLTYRTGGELPPSRPIPARAQQPEVMDAELFMWEVDRRTGKVRFAAVRKERRQP